MAIARRWMFLAPVPEAAISTAPRELPSLERAALWALGFGPTVSLELSGGVLVDITGCAALFGGEARLLEAAHDEFARRGLPVRVAAAQTAHAARVLARVFSFSRSARGHSAISKDREALEAAPLDALDLSEELHARCAALGITRLGELERLPRQSLPQRFGAELSRTLDLIFGRHAFVPAAFTPPAHPELSLEFSGPVERLDTLVFALRRLCEDMALTLERLGRSARSLELRLLHERPLEPTGFTAPFLSPCHQAKTLHALLWARLEATRIAAPVLGMALAALETCARAQAPGMLFAELAGEGAAGESLALLLDRLTARLGPSGAVFAHVVEDVRPERSFSISRFFEIASNFFDTASNRYSGLRGQSIPRRFSSQNAPSRGAEPERRARGHRRDNEKTRSRETPRPVHLFAAARRVEVALEQGRPARLDGRRVRRLSGPERIATGWWDDAPCARDYYVVEDDEGRRWWIFLSLDDGSWWLHGAFS